MHQINTKQINTRSIPDKPMSKFKYHFPWNLLVHFGIVGIHVRLPLLDLPIALLPQVLLVRFTLHLVVATLNPLKNLQHTLKNPCTRWQRSETVLPTSSHGPRNHHVFLGGRPAKGRDAARFFRCSTLSADDTRLVLGLVCVQSVWWAKKLSLYMPVNPFIRSARSSTLKIFSSARLLSDSSDLMAFNWRAESYLQLIFC